MTRRPNDIGRDLLEARMDIPAVEPEVWQDSHPCTFSELLSIHQTWEVIDSPQGQKLINGPSTSDADLSASLDILEEKSDVAHLCKALEHLRDSDKTHFAVDMHFLRKSLLIVADMMKREENNMSRSMAQFRAPDPRIVQKLLREAEGRQKIQQYRNDQKKYADDCACNLHNLQNSVIPLLRELATSLQVPLTEPERRRA